MVCMSFCPSPSNSKFSAKTLKNCTPILHFFSSASHSPLVELSPRTLYRGTSVPQTSCLSAHTLEKFLGLSARAPSPIVHNNINTVLIALIFCNVYAYKLYRTEMWLACADARSLHIWNSCSYSYYDDDDNTLIRLRCRSHYKTHDKGGPKSQTTLY